MYFPNKTDSKQIVTSIKLILLTIVLDQKIGDQFLILVRFTSPVLSDDYENAVQVLERFIKKTIPILDDFLPKN